MPAIVHSFLALALALMFKFLRPDKFTWPHIILFSLFSYIGPDLGVGLRFLIEKSGGNWGEVFVLIFHSPFNFGLLSFILALPIPCISRITFVSGKIKFLKILEKPHLNYIQSVLLLSAGGFFHFFIDYIFHDAGNSEWFWWIIGTGYWDDPYLIFWNLIPVICLVSLLVVMFYVLKEEKMNPEQETKVVVKAFIVCSLIYIIYLGIMYKLELPAIWEEPDFGIMVFMGLFLVWPLVLFIWSCFTNEEKIRSFIEEMIQIIHDNKDEEQIQRSIIRFHSAALNAINIYISTLADRKIIEELNQIKEKL
jgi:hypothetical protein